VDSGVMNPALCVCFFCGWTGFAATLWQKKIRKPCQR